MTDPARAVIKHNPAHWKAALEAAEWVVRTDRRLLGVPRVRPEITRVAARQAMGSHDTLSKEYLDYLKYEETYNVVNEVLARAREAARARIEGMSPMRTPKKRG